MIGATSSSNSTARCSPLVSGRLVVFCGAESNCPLSVESPTQHNSTWLTMVRLIGKTAISSNRLNCNCSSTIRKERQFTTLRCHRNACSCCCAAIAGVRWPQSRLATISTWWLVAHVNGQMNETNHRHGQQTELDTSGQQPDFS